MSRTGKHLPGYTPMGEQYKCFNCGQPSTRRARLDDQLKINRDMPLRDVCDQCGPRWNIGKQIGQNTFLCTADDGPLNSATVGLTNERR